ncbi:SWI5-dependent HO expression protein 4 [Malassezia sp. CBS 17886]|nr:SWI5-dependent HO expression protein 4 [Malassezia sp. CBS 17886]
MDALDALLAHQGAGVPADAPRLLHTLQEADPRGAPALARRLEACLGDASTCLHALIALHTICLVNPPLAHGVLATPHTVDRFLDSASSAPLRTALSCVLAQAASGAPLRQWLHGTSSVAQWLDAHSTPLGKIAEIPTAHPCERVAGDLARMKLTIPAADRGAAKVGLLPLPEADVSTLYASFRDFLVDDGVHPAPPAAPSLLEFQERAVAVGAALEGVHYIAARPPVRQMIADDPAFLAALSALLGPPRRAEDAPAATADPAAPRVYVILSILATVTAYPLPRTEEQRRVDRLRASAMKQAPLTSAELARETSAAADRVRRVIDAGLVPGIGQAAIRAAPLASRTELRHTLARLLLALVTQQNRAQRGRLVQQGVARALLALCAPACEHIVGARREGLEPSPWDVALLQALAKLTISTDPSLLYGPSGTLAAAVHYVGVLFLLPDASLLQLFEATMALTNLSALGPALAHAVANVRLPEGEGAAQRRGETAADREQNVADALVPAFLLHESVDVRRALVELLCNLVQDDAVFVAWSGDGEDVRRATDGCLPGAGADARAGSDAHTPPPIQLHRADGRLKFLVSLCDTRDATPAELALAAAASGTLATLTSSPAACAHVLHMRAHMHALLTGLLTQGTTPALALRAATICSNIAAYVAWLRGKVRPAGDKHAADTSAGRNAFLDAQNALHASGMLEATRSYMAIGAAELAHATPAQSAELRQALEVAGGVAAGVKGSGGG